MHSPAQHRAWTRFGLGVPRRASPDPDPRAAVKQSLDRELGRIPAALADLPATPVLVRERLAMDGLDRAVVRDRLAAELVGRLRAAVDTGGSFPERLAWFFANWFTVSGVRRQVITVVGAFEREAIRPHLGGTFGDLVVASTLHPVMLAYLDNLRSVGPDSPAGRRRDLGLNENLAREVLELHTLGVEGGYDQDDVEELARVLTGWSVDRDTGRARFHPRRHQPGSRRILGRTFPDHGAETAPAVLRALAVHPATARHLARRLVAHLVGEEPPEAAVQRIERSFLASGGDLPTVFGALVDLDAAWEGPLQARVRTPIEWLLATTLALGRAPGQGRRALGALRHLGQPWALAPTPAGWPEEDAAWRIPDAFVTRLEAAERIGARAPVADPPSWAEHVLGPTLRPETRAVLPRLDRRRAVALVLGSPEFQRR